MSIWGPSLDIPPGKYSQVVSTFRSILSKKNLPSILSITWHGSTVDFRGGNLTKQLREKELELQIRITNDDFFPVLHGDPFIKRMAIKKKWKNVVILKKVSLPTFPDLFLTLKLTIFTTLAPLYCCLCTPISMSC